MNVEKFLMIKKQTQVLAEETRGVGTEMALKMHEKNEIPPTNIFGNLYYSHAVWSSKIAELQGKEVHKGKHEKLLLFRKIFVQGRAC